MSQTPSPVQGSLWPEPAWLTAIADEQERDVARTRLFLALACLYFTPKGDSAPFAEAVGLSANALAGVKNRGKVSPELSVRIETALGRELFPRELFRPDLFSID